LNVHFHALVNQLAGIIQRNWFILQHDMHGELPNRDTWISDAPPTSAGRPPPLLERLERAWPDSHSTVRREMEPPRGSPWQEEHLVRRAGPDS
jgi:hypothetical protein